MLPARERDDAHPLGRDLGREQAHARRALGPRDAHAERVFQLLQQRRHGEAHAPAAVAARGVARRAAEHRHERGHLLHALQGRAPLELRRGQARWEGRLLLSLETDAVEEAEFWGVGGGGGCGCGCGCGGEGGWFAVFLLSLHRDAVLEVFQALLALEHDGRGLDHGLAEGNGDLGECSEERRRCVHDSAPVSIGEEAGPEGADVGTEEGIQLILVQGPGIAARVYLDADLAAAVVGEAEGAGDVSSTSTRTRRRGRFAENGQAGTDLGVRHPLLAPGAGDVRA